MMASHRPADAAPEPAPLPIDPAPTATPDGPSTLPPSNFVVGLDWVLVFGTLVLAFLAASFAAVNSDFWLNLAAGRLLVEGGYSFGKDPFGYTVDRTWVNHAWLFDIGQYLVYKAGGGPAVVIAKALAVAGIAGALMMARKSGQPVFASLVAVCLAVLAAAPRLLLQPTLASMVCLAVLLLLIVRMRKPADCWRFPAAVGGLFWLWANLDQWFFLGPVFLLLYAAVQQFRRDGDDAPINLWKALAIGVVACMLNPHHIRVWSLPAELVDRNLATMFAEDPELSGYFQTIATSWNLNYPGGWTHWLNVAALVGLQVMVLGGLWLNRKHLSLPLAAIWLGSLALALAHLRAIPFLAIASVPVAAINLSAWGRRLAETPLPPKQARLLYAGRSAERFAVGIVGLLLIAVSYAGWLHDENQQRRWAWDAPADESMRVAAEAMQKKHDAGILPAEARQLNLQVDMGNYVAWFAPSERTYFDSRLSFHAPDAKDFADVRKHLTLRTKAVRDTQPYDFDSFLEKHAITHIVVADRRSVQNQYALETLWGQHFEPEWSLWEISGRAVTLGWKKQRAMTPASFASMEFDAVGRAFGDTTPLPVAEVRRPMPPQGVFDRYVNPPPPTPAAAEEAQVLMRYREALYERASFKHQVLLGAASFFADGFQWPALKYWTMLPTMRPIFPLTPPPEATAVALLSVRAARRAIAASPDHPDGYFVLGKAYGDGGFFVSSDTQVIVTTVNLARCLARLPDDTSVRTHTLDDVELCDRLFALHEAASPPRYDLMFIAHARGTEYLRKRIDDTERTLRGMKDEERAKAMEKYLDGLRLTLTDREKRQKDGEAGLRKLSDQAVNESASIVSALERAAVARKFGLVREAIGELSKARRAFEQKAQEKRGGQDLQPNDFPLNEWATTFAVYAELVELLWYDGRVEEAAEAFHVLDNDGFRSQMADESIRAEYAMVRRRAMARLNPRDPPFSRFDRDPAAHFRSLKQAMSLALGDLKGATDSQVADLQAVRRDIDALKAKHFPDKPPTVADVPDIATMAVELFAKPMQAPLTYARIQYGAKIQEYLYLVRLRVELSVRIGLVFLEQGDVESAAHHFGQALQTTEFPQPLPTQRLARQYLNAIEAQAARKGTVQ